MPKNKYPILGKLRPRVISNSQIAKKIEHEEEIKLTENIADNTERFSGILNDLYDGSTAIIKSFHVIQTILNAIPWAASIAIIFSGLFRAITTLTSSDKNIPTRSVIIGVSLAAVGLGIASAVITTMTVPFLIMSSSVDTISNGWQLADSLYSYFFGSWAKTKNKVKILQNDFYQELQDANKLAILQKFRRKEHLSQDEKRLAEHVIFLDQEITKQKNQLHQNAYNLAQQAQAFSISAISLVGTACLTSPITLIPGCVLLGFTAISGICAKLNLSPFIWAIKKIFHNTFNIKSQHASIEEIESRLPKAIVMAAQQKNMLQKIQSSKPVLQKTALQTKIKKEINLESTFVIPRDIKSHAKPGMLFFANQHEKRKTDIAIAKLFSPHSRP